MVTQLLDELTVFCACYLKGDNTEVVTKLQTEIQDLNQKVKDAEDKCQKFKQVALKAKKENQELKNKVAK